jgi:hypothetical protein
MTVPVSAPHSPADAGPSPSPLGGEREGVRGGLGTGA